MAGRPVCVLADRVAMPVPPPASDPFTLSILELIDRLLRDVKVRYMLVGATARDLLLYHVFGHAVTRATYDLDFAILVDSWEQFAIVKQMFLDIPGFIDKGRNAQRLYYQPFGALFETIIYIIPFGKLETAERTIAWPPDADVVMRALAILRQLSWKQSAGHHFSWLRKLRIPGVWGCELGGRYR
jgi:predicted nucleotidyltransferase